MTVQEKGVAKAGARHDKGVARQDKGGATEQGNRKAWVRHGDGRLKIIGKARER